MAVLGVALVAVPTGIISSGFVEESSEDDDERLRLLREMKEELEEIKQKLGEK